MFTPESFFADCEEVYAYASDGIDPMSLFFDEFLVDIADLDPVTMLAGLTSLPSDDIDQVYVIPLASDQTLAPFRTDPTPPDDVNDFTPIFQDLRGTVPLGDPLYSNIRISEDDVFFAQSSAPISATAWYGNDSFHSGDGDDVLNGGTGQDLLDGGSGDDVLEEVSGSNVFVFEDMEDAGQGRILEWQDGRDQVNLSSWMFADFDAVRVLAENFDASDVILLVTTTPTDMKKGHPIGRPFRMECVRPISWSGHSPVRHAR